MRRFWWLACLPTAFAGKREHDLFDAKNVIAHFYAREEKIEQHELLHQAKRLLYRKRATWNSLQKVLILPHNMTAADRPNAETLSRLSAVSGSWRNATELGLYDGRRVTLAKYFAYMRAHTESLGKKGRDGARLAKLKRSASKRQKGHVFAHNSGSAVNWGRGGVRILGLGCGVLLVPGRAAHEAARALLFQLPAKAFAAIGNAPLSNLLRRGSNVLRKGPVLLLPKRLRVTPLWARSYTSVAYRRSRPLRHFWRVAWRTPRELGKWCLVHSLALYIGARGHHERLEAALLRAAATQAQLFTDAHYRTRRARRRTRRFMHDAADSGSDET
ncbi:hypothetical protein M885DRAFT_517909 [Pelagophyceae sp. CCMP2097]|nr:hypothetical protein M885DRAFT_517909 [Pelagophyceae sp. CCMP2097]